VDGGGQGSSTPAPSHSTACEPGGCPASCLPHRRGWSGPLRILTLSVPWAIVVAGIVAGGASAQGVGFYGGPPKESPPATIGRAYCYDAPERKACEAESDRRLIEESRRVMGAALRAIVGRQPTLKEISAALGWNNCTETAAGRFATQSEPAREVAQAAMAFCSAQAFEYMSVFGINTVSSLHEATEPHLMAHVMMLRAEVRSPAAKPSADKPSR
jgi:hypothetical protein